MLRGAPQRQRRAGKKTLPLSPRAWFALLLVLKTFWTTLPHSSPGTPEEVDNNWNAATIGVQPVAAERWWLKHAAGAQPYTLEVMHAFTVSETGQDDHATINFIGPVTTDRQILSDGFQLTVMHADEFDRMSKDRFCVPDPAAKPLADNKEPTSGVLSVTAMGRITARGYTKEQKAITGENKKIYAQDSGALEAADDEGGSSKTGRLVHAWSWKLHGDPSGSNAGKAEPKQSKKNAETARSLGGVPVSVSGKIAVITKPGVYFVAISNCDAKSEKRTHFLSGEVEMKTATGYLPGEELPKLKFYALLCATYLTILVLWVGVCWKWLGQEPPVLLPIHKWIGYGFAVGVLEAVCWYVSLYHWNMIGHRWWAMIWLASLGTTVKQGVCFGCLLAACIGSGITKPHLERRTTMKIWALIAAFVITDSYRSFEMYSRSGSGGNWMGKWVDDKFWIVLMVVPGSFCVSVVVVWILEELNSTIVDLTETGQTVKLQVYQDLRVCLAVMVAIVCGLTLYETLVVRSQPLSLSWEQRWIFSDLLSHIAFLITLCVVAWLWRPSENSRQMAYSVQLDTKGDVEMANTRMGLEEDDEEMGLDDGLDDDDVGDMDNSSNAEQLDGGDVGKENDAKMSSFGNKGKRGGNKNKRRDRSGAAENDREDMLSGGDK